MLRSGPRDIHGLTRPYVNLEAHQQIHPDRGLTVQDVNEIHVHERANVRSGSRETEHDGVGEPCGTALRLRREPPAPPHSVYFACADATHPHEERLMNTLPTKKPGDPDVNTIPTWRELAERFRDLVKDFLKEGKELERELEPKLLPALKRFKLEIEKLISKLEQRAK